MNSLFAFQRKAVDSLIDQFKLLWQHNEAMAELTFKAPTGSGKTLMTVTMLHELRAQPDWDEDIATVWITFSDELAMQSRGKYEEYFAPNVGCRLLTVEALNEGALQRGDILFLNWQKLVSRRAADRVWRRPNEGEQRKETGCYWEDVIERTHAAGRRMVLVIDESHKNVTDAAERDVIEPLRPRVIVKVSATPSSVPLASDVMHHRAGYVEVERADVVEAGLIKREIITQTEDDMSRYSSRDHDLLLLDLAIDRRQHLKSEWERVGQRVNPLVLVQLPDDDRRTIEQGVKSKEQVVTDYLQQRGIENCRIAKWFDQKKENLDGIERNDSEVEFMLFKYAAGTGWDCPRASVLVMYREVQSDTFRTQTLGRILRSAVPGLDLSGHPSLERGYLYTNYRRNEVQAVNATDPNKPKTELSKVDSQLQIEFAIEVFHQTAKDYIEQALKDIASEELVTGGESAAVELSVTEAPVDAQRDDDPTAEATGQCAEHTLTAVPEECEGPVVSEEASSVAIDSETVATIMQEIEAKTASFADQTQRLMKEDMDDFVKKTTIEESMRTLQEEVRQVVDSHMEDDKESEQAKRLKSKLKKGVDDLSLVLTGRRDYDITPDPHLKTEFISRTDYGDLGKATTFQDSLKAFFNDYFGVNVLLPSTREEQGKMLERKGIDSDPTLERSVMVNARFMNVRAEYDEEGKGVMIEVSTNDVEKEFTYMCYDLLDKQKDPRARIGNVARSWGMLKEALRQWFKCALSGYNELECYRLFLKDLAKGDNSVFRSVLYQMLVDYIPKRDKAIEERRRRQAANAPKPFVIKAQYAYTDDMKPYEPSALSIVRPFRLQERYAGRDNETAFIDYLERNALSVEWWLKNGTGKEALGIKYDDATGQPRIFYPDWLVKFKSNKGGDARARYGIFDTKGGFTATAEETARKAAALAQRIRQLNRESDCRYVGGIVVRQAGQWLYNDSSKYEPYAPSSKEWKLFGELF